MRQNHGSVRASTVEVKRYFDEQAGRFPETGGEAANFWQRAITGVLRRSLRLRFEKVFGRIGSLERRRILDIGCGTGTYTVQAALVGAEAAVGIDLSREMIQRATTRADASRVTDRCRFMTVDFMEFQLPESFDFVIAMGVMDYVADPAAFLERVVELCSNTAFLSFPKAGGILAWQRKRRYRRRCPLFLYSRSEIGNLLAGIVGVKWTIESAARDWFVTIKIEGKESSESANLSQLGA